MEIMLTIPFLDRLAAAKRILIAGCGGGFDVYSGVPLMVGLLNTGKHVVLSNFSFTALQRSGGEMAADHLWRIDRRVNELPYFPEKLLVEWLDRQNHELPVYAIELCGGRPLTNVYEYLCRLHDIDLVVLVDGGTDSLLFGDEPGLGTVSEDAVSIVAADAATDGQAVVAAFGFGIDDHHGVSHYAFLDNVATMIRDGGFLGSASVTPGTREADALLDLVAYANHRQPAHQSIVANSIASAMRGEFGDFHATARTHGSELFINPLMLSYWAFEAGAIVRHMTYADDIRTTNTIRAVSKIIEERRHEIAIRRRKLLPL